MRMDAITLRHLRMLRALAESGSLTGAAQVLGLTTPAIHGQLRTVEDLAGCALMSRDGQGAFIPTAEGRALLDAESQIGTALGRAREQVAALRRGQAGAVLLGVVSTGKYFAPGLVAALRRTHPGIEVTMRIGNREDIIGALSGRALDLAIMGRAPREPEVIAEQIGPHPHIIIAPPDHPQASADPAAPSDLLRETFLSREEGSGTRILTTRFLDRIGEGVPWRMVEVGTNETIKQSVIAGLGIALISQHTVTDELRSGRLVALRLPGLPIMRAWYLIRRSDQEMTPCAARIHDEILSMKGSFLPGA